MVIAQTFHNVQANIYLLKVNEWNSRSQPCFNVFIVNSEHNFVPFSNVSIAEFEQENVYWDIFFSLQYPYNTY